MIRHDPENKETRTLLEMVNFSWQHVLEVGCGDGSKTLRYAEKAAHVTAIDPDAEQVALARKQIPDHLKKHLEFRHTSFEDFSKACTAATFDIVLLPSSLC